MADTFNVIFETERLAFRPFELDDLESLARINADPETSRFVGDGQPLGREDTWRWISNSRENVLRFGYGTGAVLLKRNRHLIGWAGIARPGDGTEEIIYGLDRSVWGMGLGTELLTALIGWAEGVLELSELRATVDPGNRASISMLKRQGFRLEDTSYGGDPQCHLYVRDTADRAGL